MYILRMMLFCFQGETSAGKSSLLNLLLGADVLPYSLLCTTASICRLHNIRPGESRRFTISTKDSAPFHQIIMTENYDECMDQLKKEITRRNPHADEKTGTTTEMEIDIYWPIPMLGEYVRQFIL